MARGLQASLVGQVLVEESILGWEELELEVVRDAEGNMITVCFIENIDPLGVHTGDSFCSAPMLTISEEVQKRLQEKSYKIVDSVQVIGGTNVQWAHDPETDRDIIIEINPRTSRSSALASKATGFPIALVSAMLATGLTLKDIPCGKYGTLDKYVPDGDYVVIKFARWAFEKFKGVEDKLGTQMRAVGEVMSIGKNYKEAFQKAIRSLETGRYGLGHAKDFDKKSKEELLKMLVSPSSERHFIMYEALRKGATVEEIHALTKVKAWFINQMKELVEEEEFLLANKGKLPADDVLIAAKKDGFSDKYLSRLLEIDEAEIRNKRIALGLEEAWEPVHVSGTQDKAYYYSTYNAEDKNPVSTEKPKVMILGGGRMAYYLAKALILSHVRVKIIELDYKRCEYLCEALPEAVVIHGDGTDKETLQEEGLEKTDALVCLTGMDEENIVVALYAKAKKVSKVIAKINRISFDEILDALDIDGFISPKMIAANNIVRYVRAMQNSAGSSNVETLHKLVNEQIEALEFKVREKSSVVGVPLKDLKTKSEVLVATIIRNGRVIIPGGNDMIEVDDSVIIVTRNNHLTDLKDILK
mgnify:CR=1 FL=1